MDRRSTNVKGFVHFGGSVRSGVEDGIGFSMGSASTGSTAWIESISDDTNANLGIRAQGAGTISIGNSSNAVSISGTKYASYSTTFTWALAALTSGAQGEITLASTTCDIVPGDLVGFPELYFTASTCDDIFVQGIRLSTAATSRVTMVCGNVASTATSTQSGTGRITWIDLT
jgi:hypothetical protein